MASIGSSQLSLTILYIKKEKKATHHVSVVHIPVDVVYLCCVFAVPATTGQASCCMYSTHLSVLLYFYCGCNMCSYFFYQMLHPEW